MLGERHVRTILEGALVACKADQAEAVLIAEDSALTRFASNAIHQNVSERDASLRVRVVLGKRVGVATTSSLEAEAVRKAAESACDIARHSEDNPDFVSLPAPSVPPRSLPSAFAESTAACSPEERARSALAVIRRAERDGLVAAGACSTSTSELAVANTLGLFAYQPSTVAEATTVMMGATSSGYADRAGTDVAQLDVEGLADEAAGRATRSADPRPVPPGDYEVVLEAYALAELLEYLSYVGFGAMQLLEGRSFMATRLGQRVANDEVSIYDDGLDPACLPRSFDFEGVPKQRVDLISKGVAQGVVWDSATANRQGRQSTGHALPAPNPAGPFPSHLHLAPGKHTLRELLGTMRRGVWVSRFHYVNVVQPRETIVTGMTRDGAWWVENGEVQHPIKNLRFSQSILGALSRVEGIASDTKLQRGWFGGSLVPAAVKIRGFTFSSATQF